MTLVDGGLFGSHDCLIFSLLFVCQRFVTRRCRVGGYNKGETNRFNLDDSLYSASWSPASARPDLR